MPQKIENKDIFSPDFLEPQKKSFKELLDLIKNIEAELKDVLKVQQEMVKTSDKKSVEGLNARQQAIKTVGVASKELMNLEKQRIGVEEKSKIASQKVAQRSCVPRVSADRYRYPFRSTFGGLHFAEWTLHVMRQLDLP